MALTVVRGRQTDELSLERLRELIAPYPAVTVDAGCGDGRFAYARAKAHRDRFVIAFDPVREAMREVSAKAARKPERGGLPNVLYAVASVEQLPDELRGIADEIFVTLPWGSLMRGVILGDDVVLGALASIGRPGARLRIVLNTRIFEEPLPVEARGLPEVTPEYARETLGPAYARHGIRIDDARWVDADEFGELATTWAKRLAHRRAPRSVQIDATVTIS